MNPIIRTVYGAQLQTAQLLGQKYILKPNSTLNQKLNIHKELTFADTDVPAMRYITIGNGGHKFIMGSNGIPKPEPIQHTPRHAALYNHLPFVLRRINNDLNPTDRLKYRLRRIETHNGIQYAAYYAKVLDLSTTLPELELRTVVNNITNSSEFVPILQDLSPQPPAINSTGVLTTTGDYIAATARVPFIMSETDINEFKDACNIIFNDDSYAIISEIALCSGVDRAVTGNINGLVTGYTDAIGVQVTNFISSFYAAKFTNQGINVMFDVGSVEPLLALN